MWNGIIQLRSDIKTKRISSYCKKGGFFDSVRVESGEIKVVAEIENAGIVKHIWMTLNCDDPMIRRNAVIRIYWDGEENSSVEAPLGDFFGQGWGEKYNYYSLPMAAAPADGQALNCYFPMPFSNGARITLENESDQPIQMLFYYVDYEEHPSISENIGRFHASWNRELTEPMNGDENEWLLLSPDMSKPTDVYNSSDEENYLFADIEGRGHFVGIHYFVDNPSPMWYGEGDDMFMIDGEKWPGSLHGTGTEDFFNTAWCPKEKFEHPYFGSPRVNDNVGWLGRTHVYRFFLNDPIYFQKSLRGSIEHGHANCLSLDISSVAYWYQAEPHKKFPILPPKEKRQNMTPIDTAKDIHLWRHAWREKMGKGPLWGNEKK